ncbi:MAG: hypothetical protein AAB975_01095 [Patescibacteria group bacterium]
MTIWQAVRYYECMVIEKEILSKVMRELGKRSWISRKKKRGMEHMRELSMLAAKKKRLLAKKKGA